MRPDNSLRHRDWMEKGRAPGLSWKVAIIHTYQHLSVKSTDRRDHYCVRLYRNVVHSPPRSMILLDVGLPRLFSLTPRDWC